MKLKDYIKKQEKDPEYMAYSKAYDAGFEDGVQEERVRIMQEIEARKCDAGDVVTGWVIPQDTGWRRAFSALMVRMRCKYSDDDQDNVTAKISWNFIERDVYEEFEKQISLAEQQARTAVLQELLGIIENWDGLDRGELKEILRIYISQK